MWKCCCKAVDCIAQVVIVIASSFERIAVDCMMSVEWAAVEQENNLADIGVDIPTKPDCRYYTMHALVIEKPELYRS